MEFIQALNIPKETLLGYLSRIGIGNLKLKSVPQPLNKPSKDAGSLEREEIVRGVMDRYKPRTLKGLRSAFFAAFQESQAHLKEMRVQSRRMGHNLTPKFDALIKQDRRNTFLALKVRRLYTDSTLIGRAKAALEAQK